MCSVVWRLEVIGFTCDMVYMSYLLYSLGLDKLLIVLIIYGSYNLKV
jgi:hypothetical protein